MLPGRYGSGLPALRLSANARKVLLHATSARRPLPACGALRRPTSGPEVFSAVSDNDTYRYLTQTMRRLWVSALYRYVRYNKWVWDRLPPDVTRAAPLRSY